MASKKLVNKNNNEGWSLGVGGRAYPLPSYNHYVVKGKKKEVNRNIIRKIFQKHKNRKEEKSKNVIEFEKIETENGIF